MPVDARDVETKISNLNVRHEDSMTNFERKLVEEGKEKPIYIYNVSTIHEHQQNHGGQLGTVVIRKREYGAQVSEPTIIPGVVPRRYDSGFGKLKWMIEDGLDIAMDLCGCDPKYPSPENTNRDLTKFGVFLIRKPFESLTKSEQAKVLAEANKHYERKLRALVLQADHYHTAPTVDNIDPKSFISPIHHDGLSALNEILRSRGQAEETRQWAGVAYRVAQAAMKDCTFCGKPMPADKPKCPNCHEVVDQAQYDKLKKA